MSPSYPKRPRTLGPRDSGAEGPWRSPAGRAPGALGPPSPRRGRCGRGRRRAAKRFDTLGRCPGSLRVWEGEALCVGEPLSLSLCPSISLSLGCGPPGVGGPHPHDARAAARRPQPQLIRGAAGRLSAPPFPALPLPSTAASPHAVTRTLRSLGIRVLPCLTGRLPFCVWLGGRGFGRRAGRATASRGCCTWSSRTGSRRRRRRYRRRKIARVSEKQWRQGGRDLGFVGDER
jgi:hypothetical protein